MDNALYEKYGKLMVELEILQAKIREVKVAIVTDLQGTPVDIPAKES